MTAIRLAPATASQTLAKSLSALAVLRPKGGTKVSVGTSYLIARASSLSLSATRKEDLPLRKNGGEISTTTCAACRFPFLGVVGRETIESSRREDGVHDVDVASVCCVGVLLELDGDVSRDDEAVEEGGALVRC